MACVWIIKIRGREEVEGEPVHLFSFKLYDGCVDSDLRNKDRSHCIGSLIKINFCSLAGNLIQDDYQDAYDGFKLLLILWCNWTLGAVIFII